MLAGNVTALLSPLIFIPILTFGFGRQNYDWVSMKEIRRGDDSDLAAAANVDLELLPGETSRSVEMEAAEQAKLKKAAVIARSLTVFMTLALLILWPMPMYGSGYIFSKKFFTGMSSGTKPCLHLKLTKDMTGWVSVGILWLFFSTACVGIFPLWQGRKTMAHTVKSMFLDVTGKRKPVLQGREGAVGKEGEYQSGEERVAIESKTLEK